MSIGHIWQVLLIIIGALASAYAGYWAGHQPVESLIVEYRKDINKNLKSLIGDTNHIEISYDGKSLNNLSNISYTIANTTVKDLDKFKLYFEISDKKNIPIFHNVSPPKDYPKEAVTLISQKDGVYVFELEYLNRSKSLWEGVSFSFYFTGKEPPNISVKTGTKGIGIKEYEYKKLEVFDISLLVLKNVWWLLVLAGLFQYFIYRLEKTKIEVKKEEFKEMLELTLGTQSEVDEQVEEIINESTKSPSFIKVIKYMFSRQSA